MYGVCIAKRQTTLIQMQKTKLNWLSGVWIKILQLHLRQPFCLMCCCFYFFEFGLVCSKNTRNACASGNEREVERKERMKWNASTIQYRSYSVYLFTIIIKWLKMYNQNVELRLLFFLGVAINCFIQQFKKDRDRMQKKHKHFVMLTFKIRFLGKFRMVHRKYVKFWFLSFYRTRALYLFSLLLLLILGILHFVLFCLYINLCIC